MRNSAMALTRRQGAMRSTVRARVEWLRAHPAWLEAPTSVGEARAKAIVRAMQDDGLIAPTTYWKDINLDALLALARARAS